MYSGKERESFEVIDGKLTRIKYEAKENNVIDEGDCCFSGNENHQYILKMKSTGGGWENGAWVEIYDRYGLILKTVMTADKEEVTLFSSPVLISATDTWKYSAEYSSIWKEAGFDDSSWKTVDPSNPTIQAVGTEYIRRSFNGLANMASVEVQMKYVQGIVAYVNGVEFYRDNMPSGEVVSSTLAVNKYKRAMYRGVIHPSYFFEGANVMAVELHFMKATHKRVIDFSVVMRMNMEISEDVPCYYSSVPVITSSEVFSHPEAAFDFGRSTAMEGELSKLPSDLFITFNSTIIPRVNGIRIWPNDMPLSAPSSFVLSGGDSEQATEWKTLVNPDPSTVTYNPLEWKAFVGNDNPSSYRTLKLTVNSIPSDKLKLYEIQLLVCNTGSQSITYPNSFYSFYVKYNDINLVPFIRRVSNCHVTPDLPSGLKLDPNSCSITGIPTQQVARTTYSLEANTPYAVATGEVTLTITECAGTLLHWVRSYQKQPQLESFRIRNTDTNQLIFSVPIGNTHPEKTKYEEYLCITVDRYDITTDCSTSSWASRSYLYVYSMLPGNEEEMMLRTRFDAMVSTTATHYFYRSSILPMKEWYYKMNEIPASWYSGDFTGWAQGHRDGFEKPRNQIQLYKKSFEVNDISHIASYVLSIRHLYGCIVMINGREVWRVGVDGPLSMESVGLKSMESVSYQVVSLPARIDSASGDEVITILQEGTNVLAIAVVTDPTKEFVSVFDCVLRLVSNQPVSPIYDYTIDSSSIISPNGLFNLDHYGGVRVLSCVDNDVSISFKNNRYEWVNSVQIQNHYRGEYPPAGSFTLYGSNSESQWVELVKVTNLTFSMNGQKRRIFFANNVPYKQFRFSNFRSADPDSCPWFVQSLDLFGDNTMLDQVPLSYPSSVTVFKGIEMAEVIPEGTGYTSYSVSPSLPAGIILDQSTGWILGTASSEMAPRAYTITAIKYNGEESIAILTLGVEVCSSSRSLMTIRIHADTFVDENSWKLFAGRTTEGDPLQSMDRFPVQNSYYYLDFCLDSGLYTFVGYDSFGDGWAYGAGYTLTVDAGGMEVEIEELGEAESNESHGVSAALTFSSFLPFQFGYSMWKVFQGDAPANWIQQSFDDSSWKEYKAVFIPNSQRITTYIRKSFSVSAAEEYSVLNVRMKYAGGVVVYMNGMRVARFNLIADFDESTESISAHDASAPSRFHILLVNVDFSNGKNVIAFEVHRPLGTTSADPFVFDATGVFGVETCSSVVDSFSTLESSSLTSGTIEGVMDLDPFTDGIFPAQSELFLHWEIENLEGSKWNTLNVLTGTTIRNWSWSVYALRDSKTYTLVDFSNRTITGRKKPLVSVPLALISSREFRWDASIPLSDPLSISSFSFAYCKPSGKVCKRVGDYASVGEGEISSIPCPMNQTGYQYRVCHDGSFGEVQKDKCIFLPPKNVHYAQTYYSFVVGIAATTGKPIYENQVDEWSLDPEVVLPQGIALDKETGEIAGSPLVATDAMAFTVYAKNPGNVVAVVITIYTRVGVCKPNGLFPTTEVGVTAVYPCSKKGLYLGEQRSECILGTQDGEWGHIQGTCVSIIEICVVIAVIVVAVAAFFIFLFVKRLQSKRVKRVRGRRSRSASPRKSSRGTHVVLWLVCSRNSIHMILVS